MVADDSWKVYDGSKVMQGNQIAQCILDYVHNPLDLKGSKSQSIFKNALPKANEYTILAGIVALQHGIMERPSKKRKNVNTVSRIHLLTLTTGSKTLPAEKIQGQSKGRLIHDMHAEVLSIRLFNSILLQDMMAIDNSKNQDASGKILKRNTNGFFRLKDSTMEFAMCVTEAPCGDASLKNTSSRSGCNAEWKYEKNKSEPIRGRAYFGEKGLVRTKPGRRDSQKSLSKSCSDKLCMKQFTSLLNSTTYSFIDPRYQYQFYLKYIVLPEKSINEEDVQRCFCDRLDLGVLNPEIQNHFQAFKIIPSTITDSIYEFKLNLALKACPTSLVYSPVYPNTLEVLNKGVLNGRSSKKRIKKEASSQLCREALFEKAVELSANCHEDIRTYSRFKKSISKLRDIKKEAKVAFKNWGKPTMDDFTINKDT